MLDLHLKGAAVYCRRYVQVREVWGGTLSFNDIDNGEDDCEQKAKQHSDINCTVAPNWVVALYGKFFGLCSADWLNAKRTVARCKTSLINITAYTLYCLMTSRNGTNDYLTTNILLVSPVIVWVLWSHVGSCSWTAREGGCRGVGVDGSWDAWKNLCVFLFPVIFW